MVFDGENVVLDGYAVDEARWMDVGVADSQHVPIDGLEELTKSGVVDLA